MLELFTTLTNAIEGSPSVALGAAFIWGILSIVLSPCHLASIPLIVGFIGGRERMPTYRACILSTLFALGILASIAIIGLITSLAGRIMGDLGGYGNYFVAIVFFVFGLHMLDVIPMPWSAPGQVNVKRKGIVAAIGLGLLFGIALGPCTFAFMAPVLGVVFSLASEQTLYGVMLLAAFGAGHCSVIILAGTFTELIQKYLNWNQRSSGAIKLRKACGVLVILGGLWLVYSAP